MVGGKVVAPSIISIHQNDGTGTSLSLQATQIDLISLPGSEEEDALVNK